MRIEEKQRNSVVKQRRGGWCKPRTGIADPFSERLAKSQRDVPFTARVSGRQDAGNLGGNAELIRPIYGRNQLFLFIWKQEANKNYVGFKICPGKSGNRDAKYPE